MSKPDKREGRLAGVSEAVMVRVGLIGVRGGRTIVAGVPVTVPVRIDLIGIRTGTVVDIATDAVPVPVVERVARTFIARVPCPVAVRVDLGRVEHGYAVVRGAGVGWETGIAVAVVIGVRAEVLGIGDTVAVPVSETPHAQDDRHGPRTSKIRDREIGAAVSIEFGRGDEVRHRIGREAQTWAEGPISLAKEEGDLAKYALKFPLGIDDDQIGPAVGIEVPDADRCGEPSDMELGPRQECAITTAQKNRDVVRPEVERDASTGHGEIAGPIPIEIGGCYRRGESRRVILDGRLEGSISPAHQDGNAAGAGVRDNQILLSIVVQVLGRNEGGAIVRV